jgi:hypothetical protein
LLRRFGLAVIAGSVAGQLPEIADHVAVKAGLAPGDVGQALALVDWSNE